MPYVPTRNCLRQGRRRAFHLYHACATGPMRFGDMGWDVCDVGDGSPSSLRVEMDGADFSWMVFQ